MASNYEKGLYQEFEKLNEKLNKMISENRKQSLEIYDLKQNNKKLIKELEKAHKQIQDLLLEMKTDYKTNSYKDDERKLINRLIKYCDNHLLFLKKFFVPFSNNRAESDLRGIKIKQKTGKFRSEEGANIYAVIKNCISTYNKNNINPYNTLLSLLNGNPVLI